jgi:small subunit ribosomal protein S11
MAEKPTIKATKPKKTTAEIVEEPTQALTVEQVLQGPTTAPATKSVKKLKKHIERGLVKIKATFNNTIITITDVQGRVLGTISAGMVGFKGSKKSTPFAAGSAAEKLAQKIKDLYGMMEVEIFVKGPGSGFDSAAKMLGTIFRVEALHEVTPLPHNGCRPRKRRRV